MDECWWGAAGSAKILPRHALPACRPQPARGGRGSRAFSGGFLVPPADTRHAPLEILAPAGDEESLGAALAAGADAIYFGLSDGFNARARAGNFELAGLPAVMERIHRRGARGYLTLNTLVFDSELERMEEILRAVSQAGVDAILVQDPAVALLAREACPGLEVHASTQMTVSSPEGVSLARDLGITRIVAPRELSLEELTRLLADSPLEVEVFIHGALCVSWSGQCLTSEAWGGRSANRGQCAQSCRLPYDLVVDDAPRELGEMAYLLSPRDLAGWRHVPELMRLGVSSIKIEGRQKGPAYVATAVQAYRPRARARAGGSSGTADSAGGRRDGRHVLARVFGGLLRRLRPPDPGGRALPEASRPAGGPGQRGRPGGCPGAPRAVGAAAPPG